MIRTGGAGKVSNAQNIGGAALRGVKGTAEAGSLARLKLNSSGATLHIGGRSCSGDSGNGEDAGDDLHGEGFGGCLVGWMVEDVDQGVLKRKLVIVMRREVLM
jgi:hypothetical protein